jgi:NTP pyrophosphatase (non-canonical NTP hydrolase)
MDIAGELIQLNQDEILIVEGIDCLRDYCHEAALTAGWWTDLTTGTPLERNHGEMFMLMVSEISEAMEAHRKNLMDDKLPMRKGVEVELADCIIRIMDYAGRFDLDISGAIVEKVEYNRQREDHRLENRLKKGGKKY